MAAPGRNDPCPCGSGNKYKRCCLARDEASPERVYGRLGAACERAAKAVLRFGAAHTSIDGATNAWRDFGGAGDGPTDDDLQLFVPWMAYHWRPGGAPALGRRLLDSRPRDLDSDLLAHVAAALATPLTFLEVQQVAPGRGLLVADLLTGRERFATEHTASHVARRFGVVFGKVVDVGGLSFFDGMAPTPLEPTQRDKVLRAARRALGAPRRTRFAPAELLARDRALLEVYRDVATELWMRPPPQIRNTDGEDPVLTDQYFRLAPGARADVERRLLAIDGMTRQEDGDDGRSYFAWVRPGHRRVKHADNTILGSAWVADDELQIFTNSRPRAERLRAEVERVCGALVGSVRVDAKEIDIAAMWARRGQGGQTPDEPREGTPSRIPPAEKRRIEREFMERHMAAWVDTPVPALGNRTPRDAARTRAGRARLDELLRQFEYQDHGRPEREGLVARVRRELGLELPEMGDAVPVSEG